jgi:four helix bundle protein
MVSHYTELDCYRLCQELSRMVHEITDSPSFKDESLKAQLNEAVDSPCPNIGEGFSRYYPRDNARFVRVAKGSITEVIEHMKKVRLREYAPIAQCDAVIEHAEAAHRSVTGYVLYLESATAPRPPSDRSRRRDRARRPGRY